MSIDALYVAREFYTLEALKTLVNMNANYGCYSHDKLIEDIDEFYNKYVTSLRRALFDYTALVVYGEMRHGWKTSTHYNPSVIKSGKRNVSYESAKGFNPISILVAGENIFKEGRWENNFGGEKWRFIANRVLLINKLNMNNFCDMCFSLSHNTSPYLDKEESGIFKVDRREEYKKLLDFKFNCVDMLDLVQRFYNEGTGYTLAKLILRAKTLGFLQGVYLDDEFYKLDSFSGDRKCFDNIENFILNYEPIIWGEEYLHNQCIQHRKTLGQESGSLLPGHDVYIEKKKKNEILKEIKYNNNSKQYLQVGDMAELEIDWERTFTTGTKFEIKDIKKSCDQIYYTVQDDNKIKFQISQIYFKTNWEEEVGNHNVLKSIKLGYCVGDVAKVVLTDNWISKCWDIIAIEGQVVKVIGYLGDSLSIEDIKGIKHMCEPCNLSTTLQCGDVVISSSSIYKENGKMGIVKEVQEHGCSIDFIDNVGGWEDSKLGIEHGHGVYIGHNLIKLCFQPNHSSIMESKNLFQVGDIICGGIVSPYCVTNEEMTKAIVRDCSINNGEDDIKIEILDHEHKSYIGQEYCVNSKYFKLVASSCNLPSIEDIVEELNGL